MQLSSSSHQRKQTTLNSQHKDALASPDESQSIRVAQYALKEAHEHSLSVEGLLLHLQKDITRINEELELTKARIRFQVGEGKRFDETIAEGKLRHEEEARELQKRIAYLKEEIATDRDEKIRLLRIIDMYVNGGPTHTLADWPFYHYVNQVGNLRLGISSSLIPGSGAGASGIMTTTASEAALSFAKIMSTMAESNSWLLDRQHFFAFALALLDCAAVQHRRGYRAGVETCAITAAAQSGVSVAFAHPSPAFEDPDFDML